MSNAFIADPDASNPSRSRFERPLDTIRSFEQAIDNGYKRRSEMIRAGQLARLIVLALRLTLPRICRC